MDNMYLKHMTDAEKKIYNANYYQNNKDYWVRWRQEHRSATRGVPRNIQLPGSGSSSSSGKTLNEKRITENILTENILLEDKIVENVLNNKVINEQAAKAAKELGEQMGISNGDELMKMSIKTLSEAYKVKKRARQELKMFAESVAESIDSFKENWKSGAKDIVDTGKRIWNKIFG